MNSKTDLLGESGSDNHHRRKTTRLSVRDRDDCIVFIDGKAYLINDLTLAGISLLLPVEDSFKVGEVIGDILSCKIQIAGRSIKGLKYRIVYISPAQGENMICGMEWVNPDMDTRCAFQSAVDNLN